MMKNLEFVENMQEAFASYKHFANDPDEHEGDWLDECLEGFDKLCELALSNELQTQNFIDERNAHGYTKVEMMKAQSDASDGRKLVREMCEPESFHGCYERLKAWAES